MGGRRSTCHKLLLPHHAHNIYRTTPPSLPVSLTYTTHTPRAAHGRVVYCPFGKPLAWLEPVIPRWVGVCENWQTDHRAFEAEAQIILFCDGQPWGVCNTRNVSFLSFFLSFFCLLSHLPTGWTWFLHRGACL
jgi:hypothetical protein